MKAVTFVLSVLIAQAAVAADETQRLEKIRERWNSAALKDVAMRVVDASAETGPCAYNESESRVEVAKGAFKLTDAELTECLARAFAQARYEEIEEQWLEHLGVVEAWIIDKGELVKATIPKRHGQKVELSKSREVWMSLAAAELQREPVEAGRAIAAQSERDEVRALLGMK